MFTITDIYTAETHTAHTETEAYEILASFQSNGLTDHARRDIAMVVDTLAALEDGETLGDKHYAARNLGVRIERVADVVPSREIAKAEWDTKRAGKLTKHTVTLEIFNYSATDFEYIVRTESVALASNNGRTSRTTTETVQSFGSMKRAAQAFDYELTAGRGPEASKLNY
jgi:hypothetical protein